MSGSQKALKVVSIITIVFAVFLVLFGALMAAGVALPGATTDTIEADGVSVSVATAAIAFAIPFIVGGILNLIIGFLGLRGAKNPRKVGPFFVLCIIGLVLGLIGLGMSLAQGSFDPSSLVNVAIMAVCLYLASKVKQQA
ncbi:MAG: hypothetical protein RRZ85_01180 [Gordonibacter sp.]|uniref:hypothetical protein n=1 Tax=Gordonibacter sp. TaxID=1968902 RepID=UPI002FCB526C